MVARIKFKNNHLNGFLIVFFVFCLLMIINFFLTGNPYAARHSGGSAKWVEVYSTQWTLHTGVLMILSMITAIVLKVRRLPVKPLIIFIGIGIWMLASGFYSGALWSFPATYFFNIAAFLAISIIAFNDTRQQRLFYGRPFFLVVLFLYFLGIILSLMRPGIWGWIPLSFTRSVRGEVVLASITSLPLLLTAGFVAFKETRTIIIFLIVVCFSIVEFSFMTRTTQWMIVFPLSIHLLFNVFQKRIKKKVTSKIIINSVFISYFSAFFLCIYSYLYFLRPDEFEIFLNGRLGLWHWHWNLFMENPFWGVGVFPEQPFYYNGKAISEIGLLAAFSQYGLPFGIFQLVVVIGAIKRGIVSLLDENSSQLAKLSGLIVITMFPIWLLGGSWRILNAQDLLFWYSVFFLFFLKIHVGAQNEAVYENYNGSSST